MMAIQAKGNMSAQVVVGLMHLNRLRSMSWQVKTLWRSGSILRPVMLWCMLSGHLPRPLQMDGITAILQLA